MPNGKVNSRAYWPLDDNCRMLHDREKIRVLRLKLGISINELGRRAGIRGPSMHAIETGKTKNVRASTLMGIALALGVPMQEIVKARAKGRGPRDLQLEAMALFTSLEPDDQGAMLAAMRSLAAKHKK
jgi:transcriptional regulator with XRE-family HTH domain